MTDRPIIFSAPMVRAILEGRKSQTRRLLKPQPLLTDGVWKWHECHWPASKTPMLVPGHSGWKALPTRPGDRLWVRETVRAEEREDGIDGVHYLADDEFRPIENSEDASMRWVELFHYRGQRGAKVPPIHMPRWASRITLEVTGVKVERLQNISGSDAIDEGIESMRSDAAGKLYWGWRGDDGVHPMRPQDAFQRLWTSIKGPGAWEANPWVVAITFERVK